MTSWLWVVQKLAFCKPFLTPIKWFFGLFGWLFKFREQSDRRKLLKVVPDIHTLIATLTHKHLSAPKTLGRASRLVEEVIRASQPIVTEFAGPSLLTIKMEDDDDQNKLVCVYAAIETLPAKFQDFVRRLPVIPRDPSYAGLAMREMRTIIESDFNRRKEQDNVHFSEDVRKAIDDSGIAGVAVQPIYIPNQRKPVAILKVDFLKKDGLVDNPPTRDMLRLLAEFFAYAFQAMMLECCDTTHEQPATTLAENEELASNQGGE